METKLVIFDADNTLIDFHKCEQFGLEYMFRQFNIKPSEKLFSTFSKIDHSLWTKGNYQDIQISKENIPIYRFKLLFEICDIDLKEFDLANNLFMEGFKRAIFPLKESHEIVEYLHNKGIIVCVATNGLVELQYPRIRNTSFGKYITQIVASEEVGLNKPDPLIFMKILDFTGIHSNEVLVVGDSLSNDVLEAKNTGLKSVWYNPNRSKNSSGISSDYEISNMNELKNIITNN
jgi:YjjG family noncanonical pyrimidine nucleotidase